MNPFFLIFISIPALEIYLLIKVGGEIGALNTIALIFLTAIIGLYFAKHQGLQTLKSGMVNLYQNKIPIYECSQASLMYNIINATRHLSTHYHIIPRCDTVPQNVYAQRHSKW